MAQTIREVMQPGPVCVTSRTSLREAAQIMRDQGIGDVLVVDDSTIKGIVTDRDVVVRGLAEGAAPDEPVGRVCSSELVTIEPDDPVDRAVELMREQAIRRLPVVEKGKPVGIVSIGDLAMERDPDSALADISAAPTNT
jgi:CBS domain-containing protein